VSGDDGDDDDDEMLPACHTPQSTPTQSLDWSRPLSFRDVSVKGSVMLMDSTAPQLSWRDSLSIQGETSSGIKLKITISDPLVVISFT